MKLYLSGPMSGHPRFNFPLFDAVATDLTNLGHEVWNPAYHDRIRDPECESRPGFADGSSASWFNWSTVIKEDIRAVTEQEGIVLLPGWETSRGANVERGVAEDCNLVIFHAVQGDDSWELRAEVQPLIIGVSGYAQAGKDTAGLVLAEFGFQRLAFADTLKDVLTDLDLLVKVRSVAPNTPDGQDWRCTTQYLSQVVQACGWEWAKTWTNAREFLQDLGMSIRTHVDPNAWLNAVMNQTEPGGKYVITDCRFPNEAAAISATTHGKILRVQRWTDGKPNPPANAHGSEAALDDWPWDYIVTNHDGHQWEYEDTLRCLAKNVGWDR